MRRITPPALLLCLTLVTACAQQPAVEPQQQRLQQINKIVQISNEMLPNPAWLESLQWQAFLADLRGEEFLSMPLETFVRSFNRRADALPFTHFRLLPRQPQHASGQSADNTDETKVTASALGFTQPAAGIGVLRVAKFEIDPAWVTAQLAEIHQQNLAALIIAD